MRLVRNIIAKIILFAGFALGLGAGGLWFDLMWNAAEAATIHRTAMKLFWLGLSGGFLWLALVVWPFAALAEWLDRPPRQDATQQSDPLTSAPRSRPARSTALTPARRR
jgi:hypothetical protein